MKTAVPSDAAENVQPVGLERLERHEQPGHGLAEPGHHRGAQHEDHGQADRAGQRLGAEQALVGMRAGQGGQDDREGQHERDQQDHRQRGPAHEVAVGLGVQEAEADAEEAGQQHEVGGVGDVDVVRRRPPDQGQFDKQHEEAGEGQLGRFIQPAAAGARGPVGRGVPGGAGAVPVPGTQRRGCWRRRCRSQQRCRSRRRYRSRTRCRSRWYWARAPHRGFRSARLRFQGAHQEA